MAKANKVAMNWRSFVIPAVFLIGLVVAVVLIAKPSFRLSGAWDCTKYNINVSRSGLVTVVNDSIYSEPATAVEVYIDSVLADTLQAPALAQGQRANIGGIPVPANGVFSWIASAVADRNCTDRGAYTGTATPTPTPTPTITPRPTPTLIGDPTPTPTIQPTPTPTPPPLACKLEVDLEKLKTGATPVDNQLAAKAFNGVSMSLRKPAANIAVPANGCATGPRVAKIGSPRTGFQGFNGRDDTVEPWSRSGSFVLTDDGKLDATTGKYACGIRFDIEPQYYGKSANIDILDIDSEGYLVRALNSAGQEIDTTTVPPTIKGNGIAYKVSVAAPAGQQIAALEVVPNKFTKTNGWGWGVDNLCMSDL